MSAQTETSTTPDTTTAATTAVETHGVELTAVAATKVKSLLEQEGRDDLRLRIGVQPGGCSGPDLPAVLRRAHARRRPGP